ncbi:hypothetical protein T484DRAFT_1792294, partial [Baffinella frigidus]
MLTSDAMPDETLPRWVLLENVKGFNGSKMHERFRAALTSRGVSFRQFLLSPAMGAALASRGFSFRQFLLSPAQ